MDISGAIILPITGSFCISIVPWSVLKLYRSCPFTYISLLWISQTPPGPPHCLYHLWIPSISTASGAHIGCSVSVCQAKQNRFNTPILRTNLRARELWLLQQSSESSKPLLSLDFCKAIECKAQTTCVCSRMHYCSHLSGGFPSSDTGHECETKWTEWITACLFENCSLLNRVSLHNKSWKMENLIPNIHYWLALKDNTLKLWELSDYVCINIPYKSAQ